MAYDQNGNWVATSLIGPNGQPLPNDAGGTPVHHEQSDGLSYTNQDSGGFLGIGTSNFRTYQADPGAWNGQDSRNYQGLIDAKMGQLDFDRAHPQQMQAASAGPAAQAQFQGAHGATIDQSQQGQFRQSQAGLANALMAQANGQGPSLAQQRLKENTDRGMAQQLALAASARGTNPALAARAAAEGQAQIQGQAAQESADLTQQEQMNARAQLGSVLGQGRDQDIGLASQQAGLTQSNNQFNASGLANMSQFNAGQQNQTSQFNAGMQQQANTTNLAASVQQQQNADTMIQKYLSMDYSMDEAKQQAAIDRQKFLVGSAAQQEAAAHGVALQSQATTGQQVYQGIGAGLAAAGTFLA